MSSTCQAYNPQLCNIVHHTAHNTTLPFTGLNIMLILGVAAFLLVMGGLARYAVR